MTSRQFYFAIIIFVITLKIQKLPCLMYKFLNKDTVFLFAIYLIIDILGIIVAYLFAEHLKKNDILNFKRPSFFNFIIKICLIFSGFYFLMQSMLFYEAIQDLFSHVLFDNLSWTLFSLFLIFAIFYLASSGLKIIGRNFEVYFWIILISLITLSIFGAMHTDFTNIFPLQTLKDRNFIEPFKTFNLWFGDFILIFFLNLKSNETKLKFTLLSYLGSMIFVMFLVLEFNGIFYEYTPMQSSLISIISEQALLGVDIGRVDWFCILISEIGAVLCSALCIHFASEQVRVIFPKADVKIIIFIITIALYLVDVLYLVDTNAKEVLFMSFADIYSLVLKVAIFIMLVAVNLHFYFKNSKKKVKV